MEIKFPSVFSFQVKLDKKTGERSVFATLLRSKSKIESKKFIEVKSYFYDTNIQSAVIAVLDIQNEEELTAKLMEFSEDWATV